MESSAQVGAPRSASYELIISKKAPTLVRTFRPIDFTVRMSLLLCGVVSVITTIGIVLILGQETLLFLQTRAFVLARVPIAEAESEATLGEAIDLNETRLTLAFEVDRIPFTINELIQIGDEKMRVLSRGQRTVTVQRAVADTERAAHEANAEVYPVVEVQVRPVEGFDAAATTILLADAHSAAFKVGDDVELSSEVMRVLAVNENSIEVARGEDGTTAADHSTNETLGIAEPVRITEFLTGTKWQPAIGDFGILPLLTSTLLTSLIGMLVAVPLGLSAAIYMSEYAPQNVKSALKPILEILAGIPTVVYGFFALAFVTPTLQDIFGYDVVQFYNMLSGGLVLGVLIIPLIATMSEDALSAVPRSLREASYGLGATRLETTVRVVLPGAVSGLAAAMMVGASRAVGETMILALAAGSGPNFTFNLFAGAETMTGHIARISSGDLSYDTIDYNSIFAVGFMLFIITLALNVLADYARSKLREAY